MLGLGLAVTEELEVVLLDTVHAGPGPVQPVDVPHHRPPVGGEEPLVDGPGGGADHQPQPLLLVLQPPRLVDGLEVVAVTEVREVPHQTVDLVDEVLGGSVDER